MFVAVSFLVVRLNITIFAFLGLYFSLLKLSGRFQKFHNLCLFYIVWNIFFLMLMTNSGCGLRTKTPRALFIINLKYDIYKNIIFFYSITTC